MKFLEDIWAQSYGEYAFMPTMLDGIWREGDPIKIDKFDYAIPLERGMDVYYTPNTFISPTRRKGVIAAPGLIYADLDGGHVEEPRLEPSYIVATSNGHYHAYWFLTEPVDDVEEWESRAKGWSQELQADPGGWDATQVLRVPLTNNWKHDPPLNVYIQKENANRYYDIEQFPKAKISNGSVRQEAPACDSALGYKLIQRGVSNGTLPLSARYWLTATPEEIKALGTIDRSKILWAIECALISAGWGINEVFQMVRLSPINKWTGRDNQLWQEINKAQASING